MVTRWNRISLAFAVLALAAGCDSRKEVVVEHRDVPTEATHDGHLVVLDGGPRVELVHDQSNGTVTLYTLRSDDRVIAFEQAPLLEIHTVEGVVPVTFVRVEGEAHAWRATHDVFRRADVSDVRLIARADGRRFEESIALRDGWAEPASPATPASLPPAEDAAPPADVTPSDDAATRPRRP